ncbi:MAG: cytochrome c3 family protein [Anaerolineae bacterium]
MRQLRNPRIWLGVLGALVVLILVGGFVTYLFAPKVFAAPEQPINFPHSVMVKAGITCLYCHTDAQRGPAAGMPSVEKCVGCHRVINPDNAEVKKIFTYWDQNKPIPWVRVNELPRFVYFSHQAHLAAGFNCERCHGDVGNMTVDTPVVNMNMGWCLSCHEQQPNAQQLMDCVICHK